MLASKSTFATFASMSLDILSVGWTAKVLADAAESRCWKRFAAFFVIAGSIVVSWSTCHSWQDDLDLEAVGRGELIVKALKAFRSDNQRWPKDLVEITPRHLPSALYSQNSVLEKGEFCYVEGGGVVYLFFATRYGLIWEWTEHGGWDCN